MSRNRLHFLVYQIMSKIRENCPEAIVTSTYNTFEDVDAIIEAYVPENRVELLEDMAGEMSYNVLMDEGYDIVIWINELNEVPQQLNAALVMTPVPA